MIKINKLNIDDEYLIGIRRQMHMHPELGFDLPKTIALVKGELDAIGVPYTEKYGKSSVVAAINEDKPGFTIALRADMDALHVQEINDVSYKSKTDGRMHACGHDAHTAILLGTVKALNQVKDLLDCRIKFIFQPSEEGLTSGAKMMVENGIMDDVDVVLACHMDNYYSVGSVGLISGPAMASNNAFTLELFGKSGHAAMPHTAADTIAMGVKIYNELQFVLSREIDPFERKLLNIGAFIAGHTQNVIAHYCKMIGTVRTYSSDVAEYILKRMHEIAKNITEQAGGHYKITMDKYIPCVYNNDTVVNALRKSAEKALGEERVITMEQPRMSSEDFSYYLSRKPGVFFRIGSRNEEKGYINMLHNNDWDIDEASLSVGVKVFAQFVIDHMNGI